MIQYISYYQNSSEIFTESVTKCRLDTVFDQLFKKCDFSKRIAACKQTTAFTKEAEVATTSDSVLETAVLTVNDLIATNDKITNYDATSITATESDSYNTREDFTSSFSKISAISLALTSHLDMNSTLETIQTSSTAPNTFTTTQAKTLTS